MKWIGIAIVIMSAALFGGFKSNALKKRVQALKSSYLLLRTVEERTRLEQSSLREILSSLNNENYALGYVDDFCENIAHFPQPQAIEKAIKESDDPITADDRIFLSEFYRSLGKNDLKNELESISAFLRKLDRRIEESKTEYLRKGTLYRKISVLSGLLAAVFLI